MREMIKGMGWQVEPIWICHKKFKSAIRTKKFQQKFKDIKERWLSIGVLDDIDDDEMINEIAFAFEQAASYLLNQNRKFGFLSSDDSEETIIFPVLYRIISKLGPNKFSFEKFLEYCKLFTFEEQFERLNNKIIHYRTDDLNFGEEKHIVWIWAPRQKFRP